MSRRQKISLIVLPEKPETIRLPHCGGAPRLFVAVTPSEVSLLVGILAFLNVVVAFLLTSRPLPGWLGRLASDPDTALIVGASHVGVACGVILMAARKLYRSHGLSAQMYVMGGLVAFGTLLSLGRYWAYPAHRELSGPVHYVSQPAPDAADVPLHGTLPGR